MVTRITRQHYASLYGPTTGDRFRLADTDLWAEIEKDYTVYGEELVFGGGKTIRDGVGENVSITAKEGALDFVFTNVIIIDPVQGIIKADIGVKDGIIVGIGKAGDPNIMDNVDPRMIVGANTDIISENGWIATAGGIDCHIHFIDPAQAYESLSNGITTQVGGGLGSTTVPIASTGTVNLGRMLQGAEDFPLNFGHLVKSASGVEAVAEQIRAGAIGVKIHEDWGAMRAVIDASMKACDELDVQLQIHTDTLNEFGFVEDTIDAFDGRTIHCYHVEGAGGGHAPDILRVCGELNVLPSSTNPTNPYTLNTFDEHYDMTMTSHNLNPNIPEDVAFGESRIRRETIAAEDILHDIGAISALGADSQGMGRAGEVVTRCWQLASHMKNERGSLPEDRGTGNDNTRIKRYIAKYTINPARILGISDHIGSIEVGKVADIVFWRPQFFGIKPEVVFKGGFAVWSATGEANASLRYCEPTCYKPMWGAHGPAIQDLSMTFMAQAAVDSGIAAKLRLNKKCVGTHGTRKLTKKDMLWNDALPVIKVDPETYRVEIDGELAICKPMIKVPLGRLYMFK
jgi:urease subunit alpha